MVVGRRPRGEWPQGLCESARGQGEGSGPFGFGFGFGSGSGTRWLVAVFLGAIVGVEPSPCVNVCLQAGQFLLFAFALLAQVGQMGLLATAAKVCVAGLVEGVPGGGVSVESGILLHAASQLHQALCRLCSPLLLCALVQPPVVFSIAQFGRRRPWRWCHSGDAHPSERWNSGECQRRNGSGNGRRRRRQ